MACYILRWYTRLKTVTPPGTNGARRALTSFMRRTPLTTTPRHQPMTVTDKLQRVLNAAVRVLTGTRKFDRSLGQILQLLHWLHVPDRVLFKLAVTIHQCLNGHAQSTASQSPVLTRGSICVPPTPFLPNLTALVGVSKDMRAVKLRFN